LVAGEPPGHDDDGGPVDHGFCVVGAVFVVAGEAALAHRPPEGPLHDPSAARHLEGMRGGALDDRDSRHGGGYSLTGESCMIKAWDVFVIPKAAVMGSPSRKSVAVGHRSVPK